MVVLFCFVRFIEARTDPQFLRSQFTLPSQLSPSLIPVLYRGILLLVSSSLSLFEPIPTISPACQPVKTPSRPGKPGISAVTASSWSEEQPLIGAHFSHHKCRRSPLVPDSQHSASPPATGFVIRAHTFSPHASSPQWTLNATMC